MVRDSTMASLPQKFLVGIALAFLLRGVARGEPPLQQARTLDASLTRSERLSYLLYLPTDYPREPQKRWPLILYLHGGSLRGDDVERVRSLGLPHKLESEPNFPFVVVSPLCPAGEIWTDAAGIAALLDQVARETRVDVARVYITGHSMGGRGALYFAHRLPERFAAVLALSPVSPVDTWADSLARVPLWIIHGTADAAAPVVETRELAAAIQAAGGRPRVDLLEGRDHFLLDHYDRREVYDWLLEHRRENAPR